MTPDSEKLLAQMYLDQQKLMAEVRALRAQLEGHPAIADGWMNAKNAAIALKSHGITSPKQLQNLRLDGAFSESKGEIQNTSKGETPRWLYHVPSCRKALERRFRQIRAV
ncbi:hypothetical protein NIES2135_34190 [Leptolyngbya boryana NIES-2135]|jgi:hypothetical protein|uniref:Uncharacterized protein n=1 Tax=Leptolyngbya boryana NIES-2135 TaxID=1973484 RepID=A0A1Z4JII4_LEPBY|nr:MULTISPECIES: hypothetical protein [Leptolyngbya]BAY56585.1 hypothetical protein NIES2135_34190 [Leptolyngbya boryana NIES-2135]MBD2369889.1 hypothetical protein [Leptolyngbya sp. FACHB-161]MBD2376166.1 hypothetical protein [Leptolyngbya sp. FACHB-238]MBD2400441.1 hypothetical protein [Leptolyngbya sp. FACHB-239]MBD2406983.1 hypothetical protein [Leptolyngbya sp. FACHB-402]